MSWWGAALMSAAWFIAGLLCARAYYHSTGPREITYDDARANGHKGA